MIKIFGTLSTFGYILFGLAISAVNGASLISLIFATLGVICFFISKNEVSNGIKALLTIGVLVNITWLWAEHADFGTLYWQLVTTLGSLLIVGGIQRQWYTLNQLIFMLLIPFVANLSAYVFSINYVEVLYDIDPELAFLRFGGFVGHPSALTTRLMAPLSIIILTQVLVWGTTLKVNPILTATSLISALFAVYSTGSKKALIILLIAIAIATTIALIHIHKNWNKIDITEKIYIGITFVLIAVLILIFALTSDFQQLEVYRRTENALFGEDESTYDRFSLLTPAWSLYLEHPFLGHGLDEYQHASGVGYYSHNNAVELLISGGAVLFFVYYFFLFLALYKMTSISNNIFLTLLFAALFFSLDSTGVTYSDRGSWLVVSIFIFLAINHNKTHS